MAGRRGPRRRARPPARRPQNKSYEALAAAHSRAVSRLARDIAEATRGPPRNPPGPFAGAMNTGILAMLARSPPNAPITPGTLRPCATTSTPSSNPRAAWIGLAIVGVALLVLPFALASIGTAWVRDHESRDPLRVPRARPQHRRRLRGPARSRIHRVLRGRRVRLRAPREPALQPAPAVLGHPADRRGGRVPVRRAARDADAQAAWRLSRDRHAGVRRDHPHLPQQSVAAGQHHQRRAGHRPHRSVPSSAT